MAWSKAKTAVIVGAAILLAGGTTTIVVKKVFAQPTIDESLWRSDSRVFAKVPSVLIIRPTKSESIATSSTGNMLIARPGQGTSIVSSSAGDKTILLNAPVSGLLSVAYGVPESLMVLPDNLPSGYYDLMLTLKDRPKEALQTEIKRRFGLVGHMETRDSDNLALKVRIPDAPGLVPSKAGVRGSSMSSSMRSTSASGTLPSGGVVQIRTANRGTGNRMTLMNQTLTDLARYVEKQLGQKVSDDTGITNRFDIKLQVQVRPDESEPDALKRSILEQLGLELVPNRELTEMLVVERVK